MTYHSPEEFRGWIEKTAPGGLELVATIVGNIVGAVGLSRMAGRRAHVGSAL